MLILKNNIAELQYLDSSKQDILFYSSYCQTSKSNISYGFLKFSLPYAEEAYLGIIKHELRFNDENMETTKKDFEIFLKQEVKRTLIVVHDFNIDQISYKLLMNKDNNKVVVLCSPIEKNNRHRRKKWAQSDSYLYSNKGPDKSDVNFLNSIGLKNIFTQQLFIEQWNIGMLKPIKI